MKAISTIGQILTALFFVVSAIVLLTGDALLSGFIFLITAFCISPLFSILLMKFGVYKPLKRICIKAVFTTLFFIASLAFIPSKPHSEESKTTNPIVKKESKIDAVIIDTSKLIVIQKKWADSIVKTANTPENGFTIKSVRLNLPDTILFEYSEETTKYGYDTNIGNDTTMYRNWYIQYIQQNLGKDYLSLPVYIRCIPNQKVVAAMNKGIVWEHPALAFQGISVYKGNEFYKELIGVVLCVEGGTGIDWSEQYVTVIGENGTSRIQYGDFRKKYWTTHEQNDVSQPVKKCY